MLQVLHEFSKIIEVQLFMEKFVIIIFVLEWSPEVATWKGKKVEEQGSEWTRVYGGGSWMVLERSKVRRL